ncbi:hypothetical protein V2I28_07775 [Campylobacter sp. CX2-4080-23]|uniref:hypothetical protein n=1 Tax=Campylobacter porcelli TaxID=1660073 RepID=UPI002E9B143E|nr:hypothetical protein [Campylobacter sp. CX2-4080-23]
MDETKPGYITNQELLNLGNSLREYIKTYKEPFIDSNGARIYEWENSDGVRFRAVVDSSRRDTTTAELPQPTVTDDIITFYFDRNIKDKMIFRNPKLNKDKRKPNSQVKGDTANLSAYSGKFKGDIVWGGDTLSTLNAPQIAKQEVEAMGETIPNQSIKKLKLEPSNTLNF